MPLTVEKLRLAIVALAVLLLLAIVGSFFYGRWQMRHLAQDLPGRLGIQIQQSTKGFVLSQSNSQGRTLFTLHAARAVKFKVGGRVSLHDVKIDLYNRQNGYPDTIAGDDFEFDPRSQIVESPGEAHIVLHAPAGVRGQAAGRQVRLTTHGLIFNQKTGVATCSGEVDFATSDASGQAVGAEYDSKQEHLLLESQVVLTTKMQNQPAIVHASRAVYDRDDDRIHLWQPRYTSSSPKGTNSGMAATATIFLRADSSVERLDASDGVTLKSADGMEVRSPSMMVLLNENSQPRQANFSGGVVFAGDQPAMKTSGNARQAEIKFDSQGRANSAILDGEVQLRQAAKNRLLRTLSSNHLVLNLVQGTTGPAQLQSAYATGNAVFSSESSIPGQPQQKTSIAAQVLSTTFTAQNQPLQVDGTGQTRLETVAANGDIDTSTGDTLRIEFAPDKPEMPAKGNREIPIRLAKGAPRAGFHFAQDDKRSPLSAQSIRTAVQTGHVVLQQAAKPNANGASGPRISTATAARASYVAANDTLTLTGDPVFRDAQLEMTARRIEVERAAGKVISTGAVQATMQAEGRLSGRPAANGEGSLLGSAQPAHIIAEQAILLHDSQKAVFSGQARLWQGGNSIEAPEIELSQKNQTLTAYSDRPCEQCVVSNFLGQPSISGQRKPGPVGGMEPTTFHVLSQRLVYSDAERKADFLHHVQVVSSSGQMTADQAEIFLTASARRAPAAYAGTPAQKREGGTDASSVEKIIATGAVRLQQPGRIATGTRLIYTAADGHFVLTGDGKNPPQVTDHDRGSVTGQVLTFASREQAIMVSGASGHTTTTKTRVQQR